MAGEMEGEICNDISPIYSVDLRYCDVVWWKLAGLGGFPPHQSHPNVRYGSRRNADGRRISRRRRATLQCGKSGQGRNLGCQGIKHPRGAGALAIIEVAWNSRISTTAWTWPPKEFRSLLKRIRDFSNEHRWQSGQRTMLQC